MLSCFALVGGYDLAVVTNLDVCLCGHQESKSLDTRPEHYQDHLSDLTTSTTVVDSNTAASFGLLGSGYCNTTCQGTPDLSCGGDLL